MFSHVLSALVLCALLPLAFGNAVIVEKRVTKPSSINVSTIHDSSFTCKGTAPPHVYTKAQVTSTIQEATAHALDNTLIGDNKYPHLNNLQGVPALPSDCSDTTHILEYPIFEHTLFAADPTNPGPDRVFFSFKGTSATFCGVYTHTGAPQSGFRSCPRT